MNFENENSDCFLFTQMRLGKEEAFDFIFRKYYKVLSVQAIRYVHDQDSAQSLVQDCFVRFWEKRRELSNIVDLYSYLFCMVRNRCIDHIRERQRTHIVQITNQTDSPENVTEEKIDANDLNSHLWLAIANLPDRCRKAFEYSRIDGLTYAQISIKMAISHKVVEALISRALKLLRANLANFLGILILLFI
ncbi:MAG: RNA polymerase sigma-70 factor [Bacteroidia bacterium]|nr:RNA polymerase sigma-70 factor [Bacteroidia bacterium]